MINKDKKLHVGTVGIAFLILLLIVVGSVWWCISANKSVTLQGEVEATTYDISSKVTGRISSLMVKKGDKVKKGEVIAELDVPELRYKVHQAEAALKAAEAAYLEIENGTRSEQVLMAESSLKQAEVDLDLAYKTYVRYKDLYKNKAVSRQSLDERKASYDAKLKSVAIAKDNLRMLRNGSRYEDKLKGTANVNKARAALNEAESYLDEAYVKAQCDGEITDTFAEEGELVNAGYPIVEVVDMNDSYVVFNIREDLLSPLAIGKSFEVTIPAIAQKEQSVKTYYISALGDYATWRATKVRGDFDLKTFELRARFKDKIEDLRCGMSVILELSKVD